MSSVFAKCCSLIAIGGVILLSACRGGNQSQPGTSGKDSASVHEVDTISPRIEFFTKRIAANPKDADSYWKRGMLEAHIKQNSQALSDYNQAIKIDSTKADYYYTLADLDFTMGHTRDSKDAFEKCIQLDPKNTKAILKLAELYFYVKRYSDAIDNIDKTLKINPYIAKAYFMKGMIFLEEHDTSKAVSSMQTAVEQDSKYFDAYVELGLIYARKGNGAALDYFEDAINAEPNNPEGYYDKGKFYQDMMDYDNAIKTYQQLLQVNADYKFALYNLGVIYYIAKQDYKPAADYFSKAIHADSTYALAYFGRGNCYEQLKEYNKAMADFSAAMRYNPNLSAASDAMKELKDKMK
jgi:tetratricopeptide (TPR) repeat protein